MNLNSTINEDKVYRHLSNSNKINGIVHISHGMAEHIGRYKWLIKKLNNDGFHVIAIDHRGHGKRINNSLKGYFADKNGWDLVLEDFISLINDTNKEFPNHKQLFAVGKHPSSAVDFCLFSGTFNLCHTANLDLWEDYIFTNLQDCWQRSRHGMVLNLLCAPRSRIQNQIFYADRQKFISRASQLFAPTYALSTPHVKNDVTFAIAKH